MDTKHLSARSRAQRGNVRTRTHHSRGGVIHDNNREHARYTVIGNHLAQHRELSLTAIGLSAHIQSLPTGAPVDIRTLAARFPEGRERIAAALRELEQRGYIRRERERTPEGQIITRTISCNMPAAARREAALQDPSAPPPEPMSEPQTLTLPRPRREPRPLSVPQPGHSNAELLRQALDLLAGLRHHDPRLLLSERDAEVLAPGVVAWLEREVGPELVRAALTACLPTGPLHRPAALLAHRLTTQLPPPPTFRAARPPRPHPLQCCDGCGRGFRAPEPGTCRDCRATAST
ncbi:helix-turn-helix domain-containing protein [Streptomyces sp. NPDC003036]|uniref:helix-turn-helix domain-containing protein n=1 Tax=Streptomyces sp. NPDC003036 TaxID=3154442 RepID=UPI0033ABF712